MKLLAPPFIPAVLACVLFPLKALALPLEPTPAPPGARVYFISPTDGARVQAPFTVKIGLENMTLAAEGVNVAGSGHHHLSVDGRLRLNPHEPMGNEVIHLDKGQTQIKLFLTPGRHFLQLILGDYLHRPFDPPIVSEVISVTVASD